MQGIRSSETCNSCGEGFGEEMGTPKEVVFEVTEAVEGGFDARSLGYGIFTQGDDWAHLKAMVKDAVLCHFGEEFDAQDSPTAFRKGRSFGDVRLPRDISGDDLASLLRRRYGYRVVRQRGSHVTLALDVDGATYSVTVPRHRFIRVGTLGGIVSLVATHQGISSVQVRNDLFGR